MFLELMVVNWSYRFASVVILSDSEESQCSLEGSKRCFTAFDMTSLEQACVELEHFFFSNSLPVREGRGESSSPFTPFHYP